MAHTVKKVTEASCGPSYVQGIDVYLLTFLGFCVVSKTEPKNVSWYISKPIKVSRYFS